jgi:hypothetical protein
MMLPGRPFCGSLFGERKVIVREELRHGRIWLQDTHSFLNPEMYSTTVKRTNCNQMYLNLTSFGLDQLEYKVVQDQPPFNSFIYQLHKQRYPPEETDGLITHINKFSSPTIMSRRSSRALSIGKLVERANVGLDVGEHLLGTVADVKGHGVQGWVVGEVGFGGGACWIGGGEGEEEREEDGR